MATGLVLVQRGIHDRFVEKLVAKAASLTVGDPAAGDVALGPLINAAQRDHVAWVVAEAIRRAIGIAASQAAGLKAQFGTMCKPLQAGKASEYGILAAQLAARIFDSRKDIVECEQGFSAIHQGDANDEAFQQPGPRGAFILECLFKYHAACHAVHAPLE